MDNSLESTAWEHVIRVPEMDVDYAAVALVVIDLQYMTVSRQHGMFEQLAERGIGDAAEYAISRIEGVVLPNVSRLADEFRARGIALIVLATFLAHPVRTQALGLANGGIEHEGRISRHSGDELVADRT